MPNKRKKKDVNLGVKIMLAIMLLLMLLIVVFLLSLTGRDRSILMQQYKTFDSAGVQRKYLVSPPKKVDNDSRIIIGLHGYGDSARKFAYYTGLHNTLRPNDLVIYPQAISPKPGQLNGWNSGFCCGSGWKQNADDAGYIIRLANSLAYSYGIDSNKVYVAGFSNGAFMAQYLASNNPESIAAVAGMAGSIGTKQKSLDPKKPVPILLMHGEQDKTVPFNGGAKSGEPDFDWLSFNETTKRWQGVNQREAEVKTIIYPDLGHQWKGWRIINFWHTKPEASAEVARFFDM